MAIVNTVAPVISGTIVAGQAANVLSSTTGTWTSSFALTYSYQWQRVYASTGFNISGATSSTYTTTAQDSGFPLRCVVTAVSGSETAVSANSSNTLTMWVSGSAITPAINITLGISVVNSSVVTATIDAINNPFQIIESKQTDISYVGEQLTVLPNEQFSYVINSPLVTAPVDSNNNPFQVVEAKQTDISYVGEILTLLPNDSLGYTVNNSSTITTIDTIDNPFQVIESKQTDISYVGEQPTVLPNDTLGFTVGNIATIQSFATYGGTDNQPVGGGGGGTAVNVQTWTLGT